MKRGRAAYDFYINDIMIGHDESNLAQIKEAFDSGIIDADARKYLEDQYADSIRWLRGIFYALGQAFGAPKAPVRPYDTVTCKIIDTPIKIADVKPLQSYMVQHRMNKDPLQNQFFTGEKDHRVCLLVSSIVSVIVAKQKTVTRALEKIQKTFYPKYIDEVVEASQSIISKYQNEKSGQKIADKIRSEFSKKYISNAPEAVLKLLGDGGANEKMIVELVCALKAIAKPHTQLQDVWRVKCLFDLIPQARFFVETICSLVPDKVIIVRDNFYDINNPRNYRDLKMVLDLGLHPGEVVPLEIICQVRSLFDSFNSNHADYEKIRSNEVSDVQKAKLEKQMSENIDGYIKEYNAKACLCVKELIERTGWNILYNRGNGDAIFDGYPQLPRQYYPAETVEPIVQKVEDAVAQGLFAKTTAPWKLTRDQELTLFGNMSRFILTMALPYKFDNDWKFKNNTLPEKLFNFVMGELKNIIS